MIRSMTGYSRHKAETPFGQLIIEIKSWNARYCKVTVRTPEFLSRFDHQIQQCDTESGFKRTSPSHS